jgi:hypothetical protein
MALAFGKLNCRRHYNGYVKINPVVCQKYHNYGFLPNIRLQKSGSILYSVGIQVLSLVISISSVPFFAHTVLSFTNYSATFCRRLCCLFYPHKMLRSQKFRSSNKTSGRQKRLIVCALIKKR